MPSLETAGQSDDVAGRAGTGRAGLVVAALVGAAVSVSLGVYGRVHDATGDQITSFGFPTLLAAKAWLATGAATLALAQVVSALWMWGRLPGAGRAPAWAAAAHRWTGTVAFLLTLPVAYHCLWSLGVQTTTTRVLLHSLFGCAFYGAFASKMLLLRTRHLAPAVVPIAGGSLVTLLVGLWLTSSYWFFTTIGFPGL